MTMHHGQTESFKSFEVRFPAALTKFNSLSTTTMLSQCHTVLMPLSNGGIDDSLQVSVFAACASSDKNLSEHPTNNKYLQAVTCRQLAFVVKQCDHGTSTVDASPSGAVSKQTFFRHNDGKGYNRGFRKLSSSALKRLRFYLCETFGNRRVSHRGDDSLKDGGRLFVLLLSTCHRLTLVTKKKW